MENDAILPGDLRGKTLLVYGILLKAGTAMGVREIQRELDFSSPSLAAYHLTKLVDLSLVEQTKTGSYFVTKKAPIAELRDLLVIRTLNRTFTIPKYIMFASISTILWIGYLVLWLIYELPYLDIMVWGPTSFIFVNILGGLSSIFFWYETWRCYQDKPF